MPPHEKTKNASPPLVRTLTHRLHTLHKLSDRASQAAYLTDSGMPMSEGRCLAAIGAFEPTSVNDLARNSNLDKAQASRAAQSLFESGFVRKGADGGDGRGVVLSLTAKGRTRCARVMALIARRNDEIFGCLE